MRRLDPYLEIVGVRVVVRGDAAGSSRRPPLSKLRRALFFPSRWFDRLITWLAEGSWLKGSTRLSVHII